MDRNMANGYFSFNKAFGDELLQQPQNGDGEAVQEDLPLADDWCIWEQVPKSADGNKSTNQNGYQDATREVAGFNTIQQFWKLMTGLPQPSCLVESKRMVRVSKDKDGKEVQNHIEAVMIFKKGIKPEWEDPKNAQGGHFQYHIKSQTPGGLIDQYWNYLTISVVGNMINSGEHITGLRLVDKTVGGSRNLQGVRIEVWFDCDQSNDAGKKIVKNLQTSIEEHMNQRVDGMKNQNTPPCQVKSHSGFHK